MLGLTSLLWLLLLLPSVETTAGLLACKGSFWKRRGGARWSETVAGMLTERERERTAGLVFFGSSGEREERKKKNESSEGE